MSQNIKAQSNLYWNPSEMYCKILLLLQDLERKKRQPRKKKMDRAATFLHSPNFLCHTERAVGMLLLSVTQQLAEMTWCSVASWLMAPRTRSTCRRDRLASAGMPPLTSCIVQGTRAICPAQQRTSPTQERIRSST